MFFAMKTVYQIQRECRVSKKAIIDIIIKEKIVPTKIGAIKYYDEYQEEIIHRILYFECKFDCLILESIINN